MLMARNIETLHYFSDLPLDHGDLLPLDHGDLPNVGRLPKYAPRPGSRIAIGDRVCTAKQLAQMLDYPAADVDWTLKRPR